MNRALGALTTVLMALALAGCATASSPGGVDSARAAATPVTTAPTSADRNPDRLRNLDPEAVTRLIGMPQYVRREGGATVWQYHAGACVMDLFWYPAAGGMRLVHYEVRGVRLAGAAEASSCFGDLLVRRADAVTS